MKSIFRKFIKYWLPVLAWAGLIFVLSSIPHLQSGLKQDFILRKIAHILEYAILMFLLFRALKSLMLWQKALIISLVISVFYSLSDEYHQSFVFGRHGSLTDVGIDCMGIFLVLIICYNEFRKGRGTY